MNAIQNRTVLITGGAAGLGRLMGDLVLREGAARLIVWDIDPTQLSATTEEFRSRGHQVDPYVVDVSNTAQVLSTLRQMNAEVDILINNAGIVVGKDFIEHTHEEIDRTMFVNTTALMHLTREILPGMRQRKRGHIVNIASAAGMLANPKMSVYCASKWAVIGWSDSLRIELEQSDPGIRVTTVTPFYINTGMFAGVRSPFIPILNPEPAAKRIIKGIRKGHVFIRMPGILYLLPLINGLLPTRWFDMVVGRWLGIYRTMSTFHGRRK